MALRSRSGHPRDTGRKPVPVYEKPLVKTGEARLWRTLSSGDRVKMILDGGYSRSGTVDERMRDGSTVWIILDHGMGRVSVSEGDQAALLLLEQ